MKRKQYSWDLPPAIERRLGPKSYGRQRVIAEEGHVLIVLHGVLGKDQDFPEEHVFLRSPDGTLQGNGKPKGEKQLRQLLADFDTTYDELEQQYKEARSASQLFAVLDLVSPIKRTSSHLYETLQAARQAIDETLFIELRDEAYMISRAYDLVHEEIKLALDYRIAKNTEKQAKQAAEALKAQNRLNILAAFTFPLISLATIFGMNLTHGFENLSPIVFWAVFIFGTVVGLILKAWVLPRRKEYRDPQQTGAHSSGQRF